MMWEESVWFYSWFIILICGLGFAGFVFFIIWLVSKQGKSESSVAKSNALEIARERYAKGEISREEFEQMKKDLS